MNNHGVFDILDGFVMQIPFNSMKLIIYNTKLINSQDVEFPHNHNCYEIYLSLIGSMNIKIQGQCFKLEKGDLCLIGPDVQHSVVYEPQSDHQHIFITFDYIFTGVKTAYTNSLEELEIKSLIESANSSKYWIGKDLFGCQDLFEKIYIELERNHMGYYLKVQNMLSSFIISCMQSMNQSLPKSNKFQEKHSNKATAIVSYISAHYIENITLQMAATHLNMTPRHINRLLNEYFGTTYYKTLTDVRLCNAKLYLCNTDYSVERIAELVGLSCASSLHSLFKKVNGITISQYRHLLANK
jgi:AraC-like DNA-binding protein